MKTPAEKASADVLENRTVVAAALVEQEFAGHPHLLERYGAVGRDKSVQDAGYHLAYLAQALALDNHGLFVDYVAWVKVMLARRNVRAEDLVYHLQCMAKVLEEQLPPGSGLAAAEVVRQAVASIPAMPNDLPTFLAEGEPLTPLAHQYLEALRRGERQLASRLILDAVEEGAAVRDIYLHVFQPVQREIGRLWQINKISVAQEHYCTAATQLIMSQLYPRIFALDKKDATLVATCVAGDLHELGVRMVADFFEMDGWNTFYLGANTPHDSVIATLIERGADMLAVSATISYHIDAVCALIAAVRRHPDCTSIKILAGGYPFIRNPDLWRRVGADGWGADAQQAVECANDMLGEARQ